MKKIFIPVIFAAIMMGACADKNNLVVLDKFIPITPQTQCQISPGGDRYYSKGYIDLAFTPRYLLAFQVTNYLSSSRVEGAGVPDAPINSAETNTFRVKHAEIEYEWDPRPQDDGKSIKLNNELWGKKRRVEIHEAIVVQPEGGEIAAAVDIFTVPQAEDLLDNVQDFDWVASPLIVKLRIIGELNDGTKVKTNTLTFNVIPTFGDSIQMGATYRIPPGGFVSDTDHWEQIKAMCGFNTSLVGGCIVGQDTSMVNCYADNIPTVNDWQKFIAMSRCHLTNPTDCYKPDYHVASVIEVVFNGFRKSADEVADGTYYACCPSELPEQPEEEEE